MNDFRFLILDFRFQSSFQTKQKSQIANRRSEIAYALCFLLWFVPLVHAGTSEGASIQYPVSSRYYLIEGVHYLLNEGNRDMAEEMFRKVIFSSSFSSLSREDDAGMEASLPDRWIVAEAFYFLGKIHYEKVMLDTASGQGSEKEESSIQHPVSSVKRQTSSIENIAWAREYLKKAEECGIIYDRLHPPLLDEINRKYPEIEVPILEPNRDEAKVVIGIGDGSYQINAVKVNEYAHLTEMEFSTGSEVEVECGARYKMKPDVQEAHRGIYRILTVFGIVLVIWLTR